MKTSEPTTEDIDNAKLIALWTCGRLDEMVARGYLTGRAILTDDGRQRYDELIGEGFIPEKVGVVLSLKQLGIEQDKIPVIATLILSGMVSQ